MADTANTHDERTGPEAESEAVGTTLHPMLDLAVFNAEELAQLQALREKIEQGRVGELTEDYRRLMFARWLVQQGKLDG